MQIAGKSHSQRDVLACSRRLRSLLFYVMLRLLLLSSPILASSLSFLVLGMFHILLFLFPMRNILYFDICMYFFFVCLWVLCFFQGFYLCLDGIFNLIVFNYGRIIMWGLVFGLKNLFWHCCMWFSIFEKLFWLLAALFFFFRSLPNFFYCVHWSFLSFSHVFMSFDILSGFLKQSPTLLHFVFPNVDVVFQ